MHISLSFLTIEVLPTMEAQSRDRFKSIEIDLLLSEFRSVAEQKVIDSFFPFSPRRSRFLQRKTKRKLVNFILHHFWLTSRRVFRRIAMAPTSWARIIVAKGARWGSYYGGGHQGGDGRLHGPTSLGRASASQYAQRVFPLSSHVFILALCGQNGK